MDITPLVKAGAQVIQSYASGRFRVSGVVYESALIVTAGQTMVWDIGGDVLALGEDDFAPLIAIAGEIDVLLLGTGAKMVFLDPALKNTLRDKGLSIDVMDTGAACRTYNVLMAEGRRVAAAVLLG